MRYIVLIGCALLLAACGSSPPPPPPPVTLHGIFAAAYASNPSPDGSSCAHYEADSWKLAAETDGKTRIVSLTFANTLPGYEPAGALAQGQTWLCIGQWSVTVPSSAAGWVFTLTPSDDSPSSVAVPASDSGTSIVLDDGGGSSGGDLELSSNAVAQLELTARPQPGAVAALKAAAEKRAAERAAAAERAHAIHEAKIAAENTPISVTQWGDVIRNPDAYTGDIYTISGTVAEYNLNSNTFATVENAALVAVDANGNYFVVECNASKLGNVQPGQTFTAKVTVLGVVQTENTVSGGAGEVPDFDASTFTITG